MGYSHSGYSERVASASMAIEGYFFTSQIPSIGSNRISYFLNLHGPSEVIETACSSSLVAIHIVISAKNEERLHERVRQLLTRVQAKIYIKEHFGQEQSWDEARSLRSLAYTLQVGRGAMEERLALQVSSFTDWKEGWCYLITGGAGGLGRLEIARQVQQATIILVGRSVR